MTHISHTLRPLPETFESGPRSTTLAPHHTYPEGLLHPSHEPRWPQQQAPRPFDREQCRTIYSELLRHLHAYSGERHGLYSHPDTFGEVFGQITEQEARLWLQALILDPPHERFAPKDTLACLNAFDALDAEAPIPLSALASCIREKLYKEKDRKNARNWRVTDLGYLARLWRELYGPLAAAKLIFEAVELCDLGEFFAYMGPVVGLEDELRALLREHVTLDEMRLMPGYELDDAIPPLVLRCPDTSYLEELLSLKTQHEKDWHRSDQTDLLPLVFTERAQVMSAFKELNGPLSVAQLLAFFARYGHEGLEDLMKLVTSRQNKAHRASLLEALLPVHDKALTPTMLDLAQEEQTRIAATRWLTEEGLQATLGLCELVGSRGKRRNQAIEMLRLLMQQGQEAELRQALEHLTSATARELVEREVLAPQEAPSVTPTAAQLPSWAALMREREEALSEEERAFFALGQAPTVRLEGGEGALPLEVMERLLAVIKSLYAGTANTRRKKERPEEQLLAACREGVEPASLGAWSWYLLDRWWMQERPDAMAWCIWALGYCGSSTEATLIAPRIKTHKSWFTEEHSERDARHAITALRLIGTRASWMMLDLLRTQLKNEKLQKHARAQVEVLCAEHGWDEAAWQDRIVPDGGLDAHGTRWFDYGPRRFKLVFRGAFDVEFVDEQGERTDKMPPARKSDDADKVAQARADYKVLKKQLDQLVLAQTERLERALVRGTSWRARDWRDAVVSHPLLRHFARKLVWGAIDAQGYLTQSFLPIEDGSLIDAHYEPVALVEEARVRLVHPAELSVSERSAWGEVLAELELVQPFAQLARPVHTDDAVSRQKVDALVKGFSHRYTRNPIKNLNKRLLFDTWEEQVLLSPWTGYSATLFYEVEQWRVSYVFDEAIWQEVRYCTSKKKTFQKEALPDQGTGLFFSRRDAQAPRSTEEVPARIFSEAILHIDQMRESLDTW